MRRLFPLFLLLAAFTARAGVDVPDLSATLDSLRKAPRTVQTAAVYNSLGRKFREHSAYRQAVECHKAALSIAEASRDKTRMIESLNLLGVAYRRLDESFLGMEAHDRALTLAEETNNMEHIAYATNSMGYIHVVFGEFDQAVPFFRRAMSIEQQRGNPQGVGINLTNIGETFLMRGELDSAYYYFTRSLRIDQGIENRMGEAVNYNFLGLVKHRQGDPAGAIPLFEQSISIGLHVDDRIHMGNVYNGLGAAYADLGRYDQALDAYRRSLEINEEIHSKRNISEAYRGISELYRKTGDFRHALESYERYAALHNEMTSERNKEFIGEMRIKYQAAEKERTILSLQADRSRNRIIIWSISTFTLLLIVSVLLVVSSLRQKRRLAEQRLVETEQRRLIDASRSLIEGEIGERTRLARELHDGLGNMLSVINYNLGNARRHHGAADNADFNAVVEMLDNSIRELRRISHSLMPQSLMKYGLKVALEDYCNAIPLAHFHFYGLERRLEHQLEIVIYRIAQELAGNAIKHSGASQINVQLFLESGRVCLNVQDDGRGFNPAAHYGGMGLGNIRNRTATFNGRLEINSSPGRGTEVNVEFDL